MKMKSLNVAHPHNKSMYLQPLSLFPAILVGGPPHSGKSVLTHSLSMALRKRNIAHYALRAAPDGEGDWSNETDWPLVEQIRRKGQWTSRWVHEVCSAISQRHLPLLVDMGGRPTREQEMIFDQCNYAILLTPSGESQAVWSSMTQAHNLTLIADLRSDLHGSNRWIKDSNPIIGVLAGLNRNCAASGPAFEALVERIVTIMHFSPAELWQTHRKGLPQTDCAHVLNFDEQPASAVNEHGAPRFSEADIQNILRHLPADQQPVCLYGRAPAAAIAAVAHAHPVEWLFDVRLGWVRPPALRVARRQPASPRRAPVTFALERSPSAHHHPCRHVLHVTIASPPLDIAEAAGIVLPPIPTHSEVVIDGAIPYWLLAAIAHAYHYCVAVTTRQPRQSAPLMLPHTHPPAHLC